MRSDLRTRRAEPGAALQFCTKCGLSLSGGACPTHGVQSGERKRRARPRGTIAIALTVAMACGLVATGDVVYRRLADRIDSQQRTISVLRRDLDGLRRSIAIAEEVRSVLAGRVAKLEEEATSVVDPSRIADQTLDSVFTVEVRWFGGGALGSAFVAGNIDGGSVLVTNYHVVEQAWVRGIHEVKVLQGDLTYDGEVTRVSPADDLAAIYVGVKLPALSLSRAEPPVGESLVVIGSPYGLEGTVATGVVSAYRGGLMQFSAPVSPGDSGGPVLDEAGLVIAVIVSKVAAKDAEGLSFGIPARTVCQTVVKC